MLDPPKDFQRNLLHVISCLVKTIIYYIFIYNMEREIFSRNKNFERQIETSRRKRRFTSRTKREERRCISFPNCSLPPATNLPGDINKVTHVPHIDRAETIHSSERKTLQATTLSFIFHPVMYDGYRWKLFQINHFVCVSQKSPNQKGQKNRT